MKHRLGLLGDVHCNFFQLNKAGNVRLSIPGVTRATDKVGSPGQLVFRASYLKLSTRSHHTNSFAHIIIKFKNKKVSLFLKIVALCSSSCGDYYGNIILIPIQIDSVMFCCSKSIAMIKDRSNRKSLRWLLQGSSKKRGQFFSRSPGGEWGKSLF